MSYDISLAISTGGDDEVDVCSWNVTSNVAPMWRKAGICFYDDFNGYPAEDCAMSLRDAIDRMRAAPDVYRKMDSPTGWGTFDQLLPLLEEIHAAMLRHPLTTVRVSR